MNYNNLLQRCTIAFRSAFLIFTLALCSNCTAYADLNIVTPSSTVLQPNQVSMQGLIGVDGRKPNALWLTGSLNYLEFQGAQFWKPGYQASVLSVQAQVVPETSVTPSACLGIRDIFNTSHHFNNLGYSGRSVYLVVGKSAPGSARYMFPLKNLAFTVGLGTGVTNSLFGSETSDFVRNLHQTIEFDGKAINYRVALTTPSQTFGIEYDRIHGDDFIGVRLQTSSPESFNPFLGM